MEIEARTVVLALILVAGFLALGKIPFLKPATSSLKRGSVRASISVIIPARNEEKSLGFLLSSLDQQSLRPDEILVVDDHSEDGTREVAASFGVRVIPAPDLPPGWIGKGWACWTGAQSAAGEILVFLDADTALGPDGLSRLIREQEKRGGLISVQPYHSMRKPYEQLSAFFNILLFLNMSISSVLSKLNKPKSAFGPCLVCRRSDYFSLGGHEAVKGEILEDVALGKRFRAQGLPLGCFAGKGIISFRMYPRGWKQLVEGWTKNFGSGAFSLSGLLFLFSFAWVTGCLSGPFDIGRGLATGDWSLFSHGAVLYLAFAGQVYWILRKLGNFSLLTAVFYPLPLMFFILIFFRSLFLTYILGRVTWKGRTVALRKREYRHLL